jgi:hypothetical protein
MALDERLTPIVARLEKFAVADARLAVAALGEPDDDKYLEIEEEAASFYRPEHGDLGPSESRWAVPGGFSPQATIDVTASVAPPTIFAITDVGNHKWVAYLSSKRDRGSRISDALLLDSSGEPIMIVGRASVDPFAPGMAWEPSGGAEVPVADPGFATTILHRPESADHARFLDALEAT